MQSPFPGMDPYLESHWRDVHSRLTPYASDHLQEQLPSDLVARIEEGVNIDVDDTGRRVFPDVRVVEQPAIRSVEPADERVAVAEPLVVPVDDDALDRHVAIIDPADGNRVITVIEFLSPTNKLRGDGREKYKLKQQQYLRSDVNLVEVDLIREGEFTLAVSNDEFAAREEAPYHVCVRRRTRRWEAEVYRIGLADPLPRFRVPLRPTDRDIVLDLPSLIEQCYTRGRYGATIDYSRDPQPPFNERERAIADGLLRAQGLR